MSQGVLPFQYEEEKSESGLTGLSGLPLYLDLLHQMGLRESIESNIGVRAEGQGWTDSEIILSLIFLNLSGGDCVDDLRVIESGAGFCRVLNRVRHHGLNRRKRRSLPRRWRKERRRSVPSPSSVFRYLPSFHDPEQERYRYLATREVVRQAVLPGLEESLPLPFPVVSMERCQYKVHGVVTNMDWEGSELINWLYQRCGKSEEAHAVMKDDLAGGKLPSGDFGENAAWWWIMILALNLNAIMKRFVLGKKWVPKRLKAIRFHLIHLPGRVVRHSRQLILNLSKGHPSFHIFIEARQRISRLLPAPAG